MIRKIAWCLALLTACGATAVGSVTLWNVAQDYRHVAEVCGEEVR